ncbi:NACHT domain-containing protein [Rossellomorea aquimaris]|nr:NACHT domain-containing protein [Rossellomorea aquimaris]WRP05650.1 NACHT domain-containing protein [Rossellomorea aquimaris]
MPRGDKVKTEGLQEIKNQCNKSAIIFIHGLGGHPVNTWTTKGKDSLPFLLKQDPLYDSYDIFSFGYKSGPFFKQHHYHDVAKLLHTELNVRVKAQDLYFIVHSMGGLIVQQLLIHQLEREEYHFVDKVKGIIYFSVPFYGSSVATGVSKIMSLLPGFISHYVVSEQTRSLQLIGKDVEDQAHKWVHYSQNRLEHIKQENIFGMSDRTVNSFSSNPPYIKISHPVEENHRSICKVDKESTSYKIISDFFENDSNLKKQNENNIQEETNELHNYRNWLKKKTSEFIVPGIQLPLPIDTAWASIKVWELDGESSMDSLEKEVQKYHEWERLSGHNQIRRRHAQEITLLGTRIVLIGGPGTGKSTLAMRTVNRLIKEQKKVLYIKFSRLAQEVRTGKSFDDALWHVALENYSGNKDLVKSVIGEPDVLIADGLDECGPNKKEISSVMRDWCMSRKDAQIIITSRPVGYEAAYFHDFHHVEVLPLNENEILEYAPKLLSLLGKNNGDVSSLLERFKKQLESNKTASIAARSPLLLNFLIQLSFSGKSLGKYRTDLYAKVIDLWMNQTERGEQLNVNYEVAIDALYWLGWTLQSARNENSVCSKKQLIVGLANHLSTWKGLKKIEARELAANCLLYFTEKGIIEQLQFEFEDACTFLHLSLEEYAAACYLAELDEKQQITIFQSNFRNSKWRETLLMAGGVGIAQIFVEQLLGMKQTEHDFFSDMVLAAAILAESEPIPDLNKQVIKRLTSNITSSIPLLAYEAAEVYGFLAEQEPQWTLELVEPLLAHKQTWTRLVAIYLTLRTGKSLFTPTSYVKWLEEAFDELDTKRGLLGIPTGWLLWNNTLVLGLEQLLRDKIDHKDLINVCSAITKTNFNLKTVEKLEKLIGDTRNNKAIEIFRNKFYRNFSKLFDFESQEKLMRESEQVLLQTILNAISNEKVKSAEEVKHYKQLATLYEGMKVGEKIAGDLTRLPTDKQTLNSVEEVIAGMIQVLKIDQAELSREIQAVLTQPDIDGNWSIYRILPDVPSVEPDWNLIKELDLDTEKLVNALSNPTDTIASNAARLIANGAGGDQAKLLIPNIFHNRQAYKYGSSVIPFVYDEDKAFSIFLDILRSEIHYGFRYIYEMICLLPSAQNNPELLEPILKGVKHHDNEVAISAVKAIEELNLSADQTIIEVLAHWDIKGVFCDRCEIWITGGHCPNCNVVPKSPLPDIVRIAINRRLIDFNRIQHFALHERNDVSKEGLSGLTQYLSKNKEQLVQIVKDIKLKNKSEILLDAIFNIDGNILKEVQSEMKNLIKSPSAEVRKKFLQFLSTGKVLSKKEAIDIAKFSLEDTDTGVKGHALKTLRELL